MDFAKASGLVKAHADGLVIGSDAEVNGRAKREGKS